MRELSCIQGQLRGRIANCEHKLTDIDICDIISKTE